MFSVIFEVLPYKGSWDDYLNSAKSLRPDLEHIDGFVDNIRYESLHARRSHSVVVELARREVSCALAHPRTPP